MSSLIVNILTPDGLAFEGEAKAIYAPSSKGVLGVLPNHTPLIAELAPKGVLRITSQNDEEKYFAISYGALEVKKEKTIILTEKAMSAENLNQAKELLDKPPFSEYKNSDNAIKTAKHKISKALEGGK